jgi:hypothetical protein
LGSTTAREPPLRLSRYMIGGMASTGSEMTESEMAALLLQAQEEERLGKVIRCDDAGELREFLADIRAHRA